MDKCEHRREHEGLIFCDVAKEWAEGLDIPVTLAACKVCLGCPKPKQINRVTVSIAMARLSRDNHELFVKKQPETLEHLVEPTMSEKAVRYIESTAQWVAEGRPERTDAQVEAVLKICRACDNWSGHSCELCGCEINESTGWTNKARRSTEHCPKGHW